MILAKKVHTSDILNINIVETKSVFKLEVDESTSVWDLNQQIVRKLTQMKSDWFLSSPPDHYGLFADNRPEELNPNELLEVYKPFPAQVLSFF